MPRTNGEVARLLGELAALTELDEGSPQAFRVRAYQNAQRAVEQLTSDVATMSESQLAGVKGLGRSTAAKIREFVDTGSIAKLEQLRGKHPRGKLDLMRVPGLGPKSVELLSSELGITDLGGLRAALRDGRIAALPGMGERTAENLERSLEQLGLTSKVRRVDLVVAWPIAERFVETLAAVPGVEQAAFAGSLRRFRETVGDLDILVATGDPAPVTSAFLELDGVERVVGSGTTKSSVVTREGLQVDLRIVRPESFGAALVYFTGSKAHNIRLRQRALQRGWTLNEYALSVLPEEVDADTVAVDDAPELPAAELEVVASRTEEDVYAALGLPWIAAEVREDDGELEAAEAGELPTLVTVEDVRGDLHDHTDLSGDGRASLEEMVQGAVDRGLEYLAITDHAENLTINGVGRAAMEAQRQAVRELEQRRGDIRLLHGSELNIGIDGTLDYDAAFLAGFDWLVASVHSHFTRPVAEQTARVVAAIRHPGVTAIGHLTGRMIGRRPGIELDLDQVFTAAVETGTAIEINASPHRLDASASVVREGARRGVRFVISTDSHAVAEFDRLRFGVGNARRAGLEPAAVVNTWRVDRFLAWVDEVRSS